MKITLIDTDSGWAWGSRILSSILKQAGHQTRIILMRSGEQSYSPAVLGALTSLVSDSDVIGISCHSGGSDKARQVLAQLKQLQVLTVWGGIHATLNPQECSEFADLVCIGEGECMIADLLSCLSQGRDWRNVDNVAYQHDGHFVQNRLRPLVKMDDLPLLDFSCTDEFHLNGGQFVRKTDLTDLGQEEIPFLGSRGCAFHCTYCCNSKLRKTYAGTGHYVRKHTISQVIARAATLRRQYFPQGKYFFFVDDDFLDRSIEELQQFAEEYPREVGIPFECQVSPMRVNQQRIDLLVKAGAWRIRMGVESGSEQTKKEVYQRPMPNGAVMRASEILSQYPHLVRAFYFIIGNPFESRENLLETIRFILRLPPPYFVQAFNLVFFPGSVLYERAVAAGLIAGRQDSGYELHYRGGLNYQDHPWKRKNLYLNMLLFLMEGKITKSRVGLLPRFVVPWLIHPRMIAANERQLLFSKGMIAFKKVVLAVRARIAGPVKRLLQNPERLYHPGLFMKKGFNRLLGVAQS